MTRTRTVPTPLVAASAVLTVLAAGVVALSRFGTVLVHQCVAAEGAAGALGLRLALLRQEAACPSGSLAVGGDSRQVIGVLVMVALPVLVAHLVAGAAALGLLARVRSGVRTVVQALPVWCGDPIPPARCCTGPRGRCWPGWWWSRPTGPRSAARCGAVLLPGSSEARRPRRALLRATLEKR